MGQTIQQRIADIQRGNIPAGYRKTKLGIVPTDWNEVPLDSILQKVVRKVPKPQAAYWRLGVRSHAKGTFRELVEDPATVNMDELYSVRANDLVVNITFAWEHAIAIVNEHDSGLLVSHRFPTYTFRNNASPEFYRYVITQKWMKEQLDLISPGGAGRNRVMNKNLFLKISSYLPPLEEQRRIAEILGCCDRMIALKKELIAEKKKQKKALMQKLLNPDSGFRLPGFSGKWRKVYVSDVSELLTGYPFASENFSLTGTKLLRCSNVKRGVLDWDPSITVYWNYCENLDEFQLQAGDIVIAMDGALVGYSFSKITPDDLPMLLVQRVARLRSTGICQDYLAHCIINPAFGEHIERVKTDTAIPHMSPKDILGYAFYMPTCAKEQQAIADILSAADKEIDLLEQELAQQEQKKKSLMQLLLTGIVRV